jgi:transposase
LLEGEPAQSIVAQLGISSTDLLYRWKQQQLKTASPVSQALDARIRALEAKLGRVKRERAVLQQALVILGQKKELNSGFVTAKTWRVVVMEFWRTALGECLLLRTALGECLLPGRTPVNQQPSAGGSVRRLGRMIACDGEWG